MSFIISIETLRQIGSFVNVARFIFATKNVIEEIGGNEFNAALNSLDDMSRSNNPERELNMAITQLRSALEHFKSKSQGVLGSISADKQMFQTALLISICYRFQQETLLSCQYRDISIKAFSTWLEAYSYCPSGKLYWREMYYDRVKDEVNKLGLDWSYSYPSSGFLSIFSDKHSKKFDSALAEHKEIIKEQYRLFANRITN